MQHTFHGINRARGIISLLLGVLISTGMNLSIRRLATEKNSPTLDFTNERLVFVRELYLSLSNARMRLLLMTLVAMVLCYLALGIRFSIGMEILLAVYSAVFGISQVVAFSIQKSESLTYVLDLPIYLIRSGVKMLATALLCYTLIKVLLELCREQFTQRIGIMHIHTRKRIPVDALIIFLVWLPYFYIFYPGTANEDTVIQLMEYFEIPSYIQAMSPVQAEDIFITNHHPYLLTMIFGSFAKLGLSLGNINYGIAIYVVLHMIFLSFVFAASLYYLRRIGVAPGRVNFVQAIVMFFPLFPLYSVCMVKDTIYAAFCLLFIILMNEIARTKGEAFKNKHFCLMVFLDGSLMMLTKVYGMHLLSLIFVVYIIYYRRYWKQVLVTFVVPIFLFKVVYLSILLPALNVAPGGIQEALSVPFQQTARYVTYCADEVTEEEKEAISALLPYKKLAKYYNPSLSDPVKKHYNQEATTEDLLAYFKVWFEMGLKHPRVYLEATLCNIHEYFYLEKVSSLEYYEFDTYLQEVDEDGEYSYLYVLHNDETVEERYAVNQLVLSLEKIPVVNLLASIGLLPWMLGFFILLNFLRKKQGYTVALLIPIATIGICLLSADNGNYRYIMPVMFALPYLIMLVLMPGGQQQD